MHRGQFARMRREGERKVGVFVIAEVVTQRGGRPRLGLSVSKKFGRAHQRVRFKRLVREAFRHLSPLLPPGFMLHIRPRSRAMDTTMGEIYCELKEMLL